MDDFGVNCSLSKQVVRVINWKLMGKSQNDFMSVDYAFVFHSIFTSLLKTQKTGSYLISDL